MAMITVLLIWLPLAVLSGIAQAIRSLVRKSNDRRERRYYSQRFRLEI